MYTFYEFEQRLGHLEEFDLSSFFSSKITKLLLSVVEKELNKKSDNVTIKKISERAVRNFVGSRFEPDPIGCREVVISNKREKISFVFFVCVYRIKEVIDTVIWSGVKNESRGKWSQFASIVIPSSPRGPVISSNTFSEFAHVASRLLRSVLIVK
jgi:hypothetical protein